MYCTVVSDVSLVSLYPAGAHTALV